MEALEQRLVQLLLLNQGAVLFQKRAEEQGQILGKGTIKYVS
jgi:hypothetical protein